MDDDAPPPGKDYPISPAKLSKTPSWVMLGFVIGALFVYALPPRGRKAEPDASRRVEFVAPPAPRAAQPLTIIEAVFAAEEQLAVWSDDTTEVALWNSRDRAFSDFYEVRRIGDARYFRSIPALTRHIIQHGKPRPESPLQFTETEEQYREWREHGRSERPAERDLRPESATPAAIQRITPDVAKPVATPMAPPTLPPVITQK